MHGGQSTDQYFEEKISKLRNRILELINNQPQWISVEDGLPELESPESDCTVDVLVVDRDNVQSVAYYDYEETWWATTTGYISISHVTHWMPLPPSPEGR